MNLIANLMNLILGLAAHYLGVKPSHGFGPSGVGIHRNLAAQNPIVVRVFPY